MNPPLKPEKSTEAAKLTPIRKQLLPKGPRPPSGSREAKRVAAAILEVLGGVLRPGDAASALSVTLARYYQLEARALGGLVQACEPRGKGRGPRKDHPERELEALKQNVTRLQQECARYAALVRVSQRNAGLPPVPVKPKTDPKGRKARKPAVRALLAVKRMAVEGAVPASVPAGSGDARPVPT